MDSSKARTEVRSSRTPVAVLLGILLACAGVSAAWAYAVGPALTVEQLTAEADLVFKGQALGSKPVQDEWFRAVPGFVAQETEFKVISVLQGSLTGATVRFRHYGEDRQAQGGIFQPQYYRFQPGRSYLVFGKRQDADAFRQLQANHTARPGQAVLRCLDEQPITAKTVKEALWVELVRLLKAPADDEVTYAIDQLDQMSGGGSEFAATKDFDRVSVLKLVHDLIRSSTPSSALAAIDLVGSHNPYLSDGQALFWLATVGSGELPGIGKMDPKMKNPGGERYWEDLAALAQSNAADEIRVRAIRALGLVREPSLAAPIQQWLSDPASAVRASATLLLADFPSQDAGKGLVDLAGDPSAEVRVCVAHAIGFAQRIDLAGTLAQLVRDKASNVREAAAMSLLSFSPTNPVIATIFRANLDNQEFKPLFLLGLAPVDPAEHLDILAAVVEQQI